MAAMITVLACAVLGLEVIAIRRMHRTSLCDAPTEPIELGSNIDGLLARAAIEITALFDLHACWFEPFPFDVLLPRIEDGRIVLPGAEPGVVPWSNAAVELPIRLDGLTLGRFVLVSSTPTSGVALPPSARGRALAIAARLGAPLATALTRGDAPRLAALPAATAVPRARIHF
jgi:hypothetical protein